MRYDREMRFAQFRRGPAHWRTDGPFQQGFPDDFEYDIDYEEEDDDLEYDVQFRARYDEEFEDDTRGRRSRYDREYRGARREELYPARPSAPRSDTRGERREERDDEQFRWGDGYVGGRGYGGTNYDLTHGYRTTAATRGVNESGRVEGAAASGQTQGESSPATRGGYEWGQEHELMETFGPARYGHGPYHDRLQRQRRSDDEIRKDVEDTLFYDTWVDADRITVDVKEGVVTLRGELPDYQEIRYATDDAWDVEGVRGLRNELSVGARDDRSADVRSDVREAGSARETSRGGQKPKKEKEPPANQPGTVSSRGKSAKTQGSKSRKR